VASVAAAKDKRPATGKRHFVWVEVDPAERAAFEQEAQAAAADRGLRKLGVGPWLAVLGRQAVAARKGRGR
jgi:hypothetical protein